MAIVKSKKADLNIHYKKYFQISVILVLFLLIAAFKYAPAFNLKPKIVEKTTEWIDLEKIAKTKQPPLPPVLNRPQTPQITISDTPDDIFIEPTDIFDRTENVIPPRHTESNRIVEEEEPPFFVVEEMPLLIGGLESIAKNVHYTEIAKRIGIEGKVYIQALVDKKGDISEAKVVKGLLPELDEIALNAVMIAKFNPGMQRGKPVKVWITIPIQFKLK